MTTMPRVFSYNRTSKLNIPRNMRVLKLPDSPVFADYQTIGPSGRHKADINGRAAAIEGYLDAGPEPVVRWVRPPLLSDFAN